MEERKIEYTKSQSNAVNAPVSDMIVSAAAGSGKTAVLTGRLIRFLCGEGDTEPVDISKMLIVTYTKAAALQLKSKISKAIRKEIKKAPENKRLRTQLRRLEKAKISTIHSFCLDVIKDNFLALGLPAGIRVGDAVEIELVMKQCMEDTLDKFCETSETFADFMDNCTVLRDNSLSGRLTKLYSDLRNMREGIEFLRISSEKMQMAADGDISQSDYFKAIVKPIDRNFAFFKKNFISLLDEALDRGDEGYFKASFDAIIAYIDGWQDAKSEGLSGAYAYLSAYSSPAFKRNAPEDLKQRCSDLKTYFREYINKLKEKLYFGDYKNDCIQSAKYSMALYEFLSDFEAHFKKEKIRLGMLDYSDLERYTYDILYTKDGEKSEKAKEIADRISQIYIDECQDINEVQDAIFTAISRNNRFMVGDIKQSIYGFRGAEPSLFAAYRESFDDYSVGDAKIGGKRIFLSENFRSDAPILDFANMVFETLFNNNSGRIPYLEEDALVHAKKEDKDREKPEIVLLDKDLGFDETKYVCSRIKELHESGVAYSDIAIISRKNAILDEAAKYLAEMNIPYSGKESSSIFDSPDVLLLICILNCIDNPAREVYLAGALKSPVFGVTLDELTEIRMKYRDRSLYSALMLYTEEYGFEKGRNFLDTLNELRLYSESKSSDKIVWNIISKTPIKASAVATGLDKDSIMRFYDLSRRYEHSSFKGLHSFIKYVNSLIEAGASDDEELSAPAEKDAVTLMTIHKSKGLEFDYVFLVGSSKSLLSTKKIPEMPFDKELGIAPLIRDKENLLKHNTLLRQAILERFYEDFIDEEMRILYVALTRPVSRLIITYAEKKAEERFREMCGESDLISPFLVEKHLSYMSWMSYALKYKNRYTLTVELFSESENEGTDVELPKPETSPELDENIRDELVRRLNFVYPYMSAVSLPTKLSISKLYPGILDEYDGEKIRSERSEFLDKPSFIDQSVKVGAAERGTATHLFMQFCDFRRVEELGVDEEIERLVEERFITRAIADLIYRDKVQVFFKSGLYKMISESDDVIREKRFNTRLGAAQFTLDKSFADELKDETVLVQGVVDCVVRDKDGEYVLIDYKTDYLPNDYDRAVEILRERYENQLKYYKLAIERVMGVKVKENVIYSFSLGKEIYLSAI